MSILDFFRGRGSQHEPDGKTQRSMGITDPNHPDFYKRYWTENAIRWTGTEIGVQVRDTRVYLLRNEGDQLIATRHTEDLAMAYAKTMSARRRLPIVESMNEEEQQVA